MIVALQGTNLVEKYLNELINRQTKVRFTLELKKKIGQCTVDSRTPKGRHRYFFTFEKKK